VGDGAAKIEADAPACKKGSAVAGARPGHAAKVEHALVLEEESRFSGKNRLKRSGLSAARPASTCRSSVLSVRSQ